MLVLSISFCAIEATTEDGKKVILHNNGTWKFENPAENAKFKEKVGEIKVIVTEASDFALNSPEPDIKELWTDVYAG